jgi:glycosyltransferase involved in cell wall biosynthesis
MPEFFGEVALYYRPEDPNDLAGQIGVALGTSPEERRAKQRASQARAQNFKWSETARKTIDLLEAVARRDK